MMVVGIVILYWTTMVVGSRSFSASHRRSTGWLLLWWWAVVVFMLIIEDQLYYCKRRSTVLLEDRLYYRKIKYHWKINCCVGRSTVLLEDKLYYWKINCDIGRSVIFSEDQLYWRQSTGIDGNYRSRKITARKWLHKYVGAECGASSLLYTYIKCVIQTSVRPKPEIPSFDLYMGPLVHTTNHDRSTACPSVRPSGEVSGHLPENAWREWPEILPADVSWPPPELINLWPWSFDF